MLGRHALVPEDPAELVDTIEAAHHQALEVKLQRDAQEERDVERVVVGRERPRRRTAGDRLHHRRLDLQEPARVQERADRLDEAGPEPEHFADAGVHEEVHVPLAVPRLHVPQPVPFLRQRPDRLREEAPGLDLDGQLARSRAHEVASHAHEISHVQVGEARIGVSEDVGPRVELDRAGLVEHMGEAGLAVVPDRHDASRRAHRPRSAEFLVRGGVPPGVQQTRPVRHWESGAEWIDPRGAQGPELLVAPADDLVPGRGSLAVHRSRRLVRHPLPISAPRTGTPR